MPRRFILLVEDNADQVGVWKAEFAEFNDDDTRPFKVVLLTAATVEEARNALEEYHIDAAIVDLRIPRAAGGDLTAQSGNEILRQISETIAGPIAVFSAHAGEIGDFVASTPIKVFTKEAAQLRAIVDWFCEHDSLMTAVRATVTDVRRETARIFSGSIWKRWDQTKALGLTPDQLRQVVTRQVVSHVAEQLSLPLNNVLPYHPFEFYFEPPLRTDRLHTGDLLAIEGEVYVILTPQCDMVRGYPEKVILAKCKQIENWAGVPARERQRYATQNHAQKSHFLPQCGARGPWTVDFKWLITIDGGDADRFRPMRFASIAPQFIPNLIQRFSSFIGRIGQPELDV
ncbi:MAG: hypothetical protein ACLQJR_09395 [Stellaceae bacterium]